ncbi:hypothetical protein [Gracilimonas sediminicola]|uniref:hypothetical protein n=1 Tax=Gracilimonas sediminicola TaxID=2952158 RepID=UPI0038D45BEF
MENPTFTEELTLLKNDLNNVLERFDALHAHITSEYLTTKQFAVLVNRDVKTIQNKVSKGPGHAFEKLKKENGIWLIHKSELEGYNRK